MKKKKVLLLSVLTIVAIPCLASCSNKLDDIDKMLISLRKGFRLDGEIEQTCNYLSSSTSSGGVLTGETATNKYEQTIVFQNKEEVGFSSILTQTNENGEKKVVYESTVTEGEDGYAYYHELNYDNTVSTDKVVDSNYQPVNYGFYCTNPFALILKEDLTKIDDNTYSLAKNKAAYAAATMLGVVDDAFYGVIDSFTLKVDGSKLLSLEVIPTQIEDSTTDYTNWSQVYFLLDNVARFNVSEIAEAEIYKASPRQYKKEHDNLKTALEKIGTNFTITKVLNPYTDGIKEESQVLKFYYDGKDIYFKAGTTDAIDPINDLLLHQYEGRDYLVALGYDESKLGFTMSAGSSFSQLNGIKYEEALPIISEISPEIFDYNVEKDVYTICDDLVSYIGALCFIPPLGYEEYLDGYGTSCEVSLTADNSLDMISFEFNIESLYTLSGDVQIYIDNIGTTVLPYDASNKIL